MLDENGEPIYGERDVVDLEVVAALAVPFWLAGSVGNPEGLNEALAQGAAGVQVGTPFAFCAESDLREDIKADVHRQAREGTLRVFTDPVASPTGFPFKTLQLAGTSSEASIYEGRKRVCDLGYLREAYALEDGKLGWRCSGEPLDTWEKKRGSLEEAAGRKCLCNSLTANIGLAQLRENETREPALVTSGDSVAEIARFEECYSAADVIRYLLGE
jgi:nitronate monooxygenase